MIHLLFAISLVGVAQVKAADEKRVRYFEKVGNPYDSGKDGRVQKVVWGYKDGKGNVVIPAEYSSVMTFREGRAYVYDEAAGGWKLIDTEGKQVGDTIYSGTPTPFYQGVSIVSTESEGSPVDYFLINKSGERITKQSYYSIYLDAHDNYRVTSDGYKKTGVIDKNGKTLIKVKEQNIYCSSNVYNCYEPSNGTNPRKYYAKNGKLLASGPDKGIYSEYLGDNVAIVKSGKYTIYNAKSGKKVKTLKASISTIGSSDLYCDQPKIFTYKDSKDKYGLCDNNGKIIIKAKFAYVNTSGNKYSVATMSMGAKSIYSIYNEKGKYVAKFKPGEYVQPLPGNLFIVRYNDSAYKSHCKIVNVNKKTIVKKDTYDTIIPRRVNISGKGKTYYYITVTKNGKTGILSMAGKVVLKPKFDTVSLENGYFVVKKGGKEGLYTFDGKKIFDTEYDMILPRVYDIHESSFSSNIYARKYFTKESYEYYEADGTLIGTSSAEIESNMY